MVINVIHLECHKQTTSSNYKEAVLLPVSNQGEPSNTKNHLILLSTAIVYVEDAHSECRVLLDSELLVKFVPDKMVH